MSSISNNPLSKEEQEEEEMRNELKDAGVLEDMDKKQMEELIGVLNESKKNVSVPMDQFELNPSTSSRSEEKSLPSFSYSKSSVNSDSTASKSSTFRSQNREKSPDLAINKSFERNLNENNDFEEDSIYDSTYNLNKEFPPLGNRANSNMGETRTLRARKPTAATIKKAAQERWRLDPFQFENHEVPSLLPELPRTKPFLQVEDLDSERFNEAFEEIKVELDRIHEIFMDYSNEGNKLGSPIKVGMTKIVSPYQ